MLKFYQGRKVRCKTCRPCLAEECGACANCLDKPKFGGHNKRRQACCKRKCVSLIPPIKPKVTPSLRPWVKYAPSPSHASPSAGILKSKRTADDLDSSNDVSFTTAYVNFLYQLHSIFQGSPVSAKRLRLDMGGDVPAPRRVHFNDNPVSESVEIPRTPKQQNTRKKLQMEVPRKKKAKTPKIPKFKVTVIGLCRFYNMLDYPLPVTDKMREHFQDFSSFETFYVPLLTSVNPMSHLLLIKMFVRAKWREEFTSEAGVV